MVVCLCLHASIVALSLCILVFLLGLGAMLQELGYYYRMIVFYPSHTVYYLEKPTRS
jgi:hypothetical protein